MCERNSYAIQPHPTPPHLPQFLLLSMGKDLCWRHKQYVMQKHNMPEMPSAGAVGGVDELMWQANWDMLLKTETHYYWNSKEEKFIISFGDVTEKVSLKDEKNVSNQGWGSDIF